MKTILVTGGAGFIGSHLCEVLLKDNNKVIVIDNFNDYYNPEIKRRNIKEIQEMCIDNKLKLENFKVYEGDIRSKEFLLNVFKNKIDIVIHLAAMAGVRPSIEKPELYYDVNIMGTINLLEECKKNRINKMVFASSSSVYGNNKKVPFSVEDSVDNPISPYAATKKAGELLCHTYHHLYNINFACLRFFTVYGPRQRPDLAIHKFTKLIMKEKPIPFYGDGTTSRDYTYIDDVMNGIVGAINFINTEKKVFEIFNIGGDKTVTLKEMVETIEKSLNKKSIINKMPMQPGDVNRTCADISKSTRILGYTPSTKFLDGIQKFVYWLDKRDY